MKRFWKIFSCLLLTSAICLTLSPMENTVTATAAIAETRCGWFWNPTPANAWFTDRAGEWTIGVQGGYQAEGDWPDFPSSRWVKTNGSYGYGCACMRVTTNRAEMQVVRILSSYSKPLSDCRKDKALKTKEPK